MKNLYFIGLVALVNTQGNAALEENSSFVSSDIETGQHRKVTVPSQTFKLLQEDYNSNARDILRFRWFLRKAAVGFEAFGNTFVYLSAGAPAVAGAIRPFSEELSATITSAGLVCLGIHVTFIGMAKCSARLETEKENQVNQIAQQEGFTKNINLSHEVIDERKDKE